MSVAADNDTARRYVTAALRASVHRCFIKAFAQNTASGGSINHESTTHSHHQHHCSYWLGMALRSAQRHTSDAVPSWEWVASGRLLTEPTSRCGPILNAPGRLRGAELLAWRTLRDTIHHQEIHDVVWWGHFDDASGQQHWVVTVGQQGATDTAWSHNYVCDGHEQRYLVFDHPPRTAELRPLTLEMFRAVDAPWIRELHIRSATWNRILRDPPSLSTPTVP